MNLLLHICCAPCSVACVQSLRAEGLEPAGYWYNPNIHPVTEYRIRRDTLVAYAASIGLALTVNDEYGLRPFAQAVAGDIDARCDVCYAARMRQTARFAAENGCTHFTSTLFISPYQRHERLRAAAEQAAAEFGVAFLYRDFRSLFRAGQEEAKALDLYRQKYCGCVFSEEERYLKTARAHTVRPADGSAETPTGEQAAARLLAASELERAGRRFEECRAAWAEGQNRRETRR